MLTASFGAFNAIAIATAVLFIIIKIIIIFSIIWLHSCYIILINIYIYFFSFFIDPSAQIL